MDDKLRRRLKRMGVVRGFKALEPASPPPAPKTAVSRSRAAVSLPGAEVATPEGPVWVERRVYQADYQHGRYPLGHVGALPPNALALLGVPDLGARPAFLDTETTGLAGGAGTLAFLTGVGVWAQDCFTLHLIFMRSPDEEPAALHYLEDVLAEATGLVTFNGRGFDVPLLETRFILNRKPPLCLTLPHLDLLLTARQLWRDHLPSRRLGVLETDILQIQRTHEDLPSSLIPWMYRQYLQTGDVREITRIFYHNVVDILSLLTLLVHAAQMIASPEDLPLAAAEWVGVGRMLDRAGCEDEAFAAWRYALSGELEELPVEVAARIWQTMGLRYKRRAEWPQALAVWTSWLRGAPLAVDPLVERAKYYEWTAHDLAAALHETELALARAGKHPQGMRKLNTLAELEHRRARLQRKLARISES